MFGLALGLGRSYLNFPAVAVSFGRGRYKTANRRHLPVRRLPQEIVFPQTRLFEVEDRRRWSPEEYVPYKRITGGPVRYKAVANRRSAPKEVPMYIGYMNPGSVVVCIRRKIRREVMHALGVAGGRVGPPKFNESSMVRC